MAAPKGSVRFKSLAGAEMRWRYMPKFPYGEGRPGTRVIMPDFKNELTRMFVDLWILSGLGPAERIVSAGAWVPEGTNGRGPDDRHVQGIAIDLDAIHWPGESLILHPDHSEPDFYFGFEAHLRCYFHTVLGYSYNDEHMGHIHVDSGKELRACMASSAMHTRFRQGTMKFVWHENGNPYYTGKIDGKWGPKSKAAWKRLMTRLMMTEDVYKSLPAWLWFLKLTSVQGMRLQ